MERNSLKPLFRFPGGKQTELKHYIDLIPKTDPVDGFTTYVEPFVGGAATFFALNHGKHNVIADTDPQIINFYEQIQKGQGPVLHSLVQDVPNSKKNYLYVRDSLETGPSDLLDAFKFYYLRQTCFRGIDQRDRDGHFNTSWNTTDNPSINSNKLLDPAYPELLQRTEVLRQSFEQTMTDHDDCETFCFLDPPYPGKDHYSSDFDTKAHERLADLFGEAQSKCLLIVEDSELIRELYHNNIVGSYSKAYNMKRDHKVRSTKHLIIANYL